MSLGTDTGSGWPSARDQPPSSSGITRNRYACTECRKSKLRCDAPKNPCSRCSRLGLKCEVTSTKRLNKSRKIETLEKELQHLRSVVESNATSGPANIPATGTTVGISYLHPAYSVEFHQSLPVPRQFQTSTGDSRTIETVEIEGAEVEYLFQKYFAHYHPFLPFLSPSKTTNQYYDDSILLFWSIVCVAARRCRTGEILLSKLTGPVTRLLWATISSTPISLFSLQAIIVLSAWPFPTARLTTDPSHVLTGIAINSAMCLGLNRHGAAVNLTESGTIFTETECQERRRTWAACNILSETVCSRLGHSTPAQTFDWGIDRACESGSSYSNALHPNLRHHLTIQRFCNRVNKLMTGNRLDPNGFPSDGERYSMMNMLENDFGSLELALDNELSNINQLHLQAVKLYLHLFHFFDSCLSEARQAGILRAYNIATSFISTMVAADTASDVLAYTPVYLIQSLSTAAQVIFKVLNSSYHRFVDGDAGSMSFHTATVILRRSSLESNDIGDRAASRLTQLWRAYSIIQEKKQEEPVLQVKNRLGASLMYDFLWQYRDHCGIQANGATIDRISSSTTHSCPPTIVPDPMMNWEGLEDLDLCYNF
ncbi:uncharacterized protein PV07_09273 [Cladophialophora immunda]|uniref:Zn(2)-C6 fungal-type domain-containing protein n=2 Tax=Cladophialophora immunda TaxID=569365 RepID=A0A0D2C4Q2_9EURO|nr:uncharacterized protein PV07_09273 [Cladophialophora immunda]KIW26153.1 hypothetical protein PV07_09273 [Cladophialophora immunda]